MLLSVLPAELRIRATQDADIVRRSKENGIHLRTMFAVIKEDILSASFFRI